MDARAVDPSTDQAPSIHPSLAAHLPAQLHVQEYSGYGGSAAFCRLAAELALGPGNAALAEGRTAAVQTLSGTGALRVCLGDGRVAVCMRLRCRWSCCCWCYCGSLIPLLVPSIAPPCVVKLHRCLCQQHGSTGRPHPCSTVLPFHPLLSSPQLGCEFLSRYYSPSKVVLLSSPTW